jgi:hypothetical protein
MFTYFFFRKRLYGTATADVQFKSSNFIATASTISAGSLPTRMPQVHLTVSCLFLKSAKLRPLNHSTSKYVLF